MADRQVLEIVGLLRTLADRASDPEHPEGWLDYWDDEAVATVRAAAEMIDEFDRLINAR